MVVEQLRKEWLARERAMPINHGLNFTSDGLVMGAGTVLVPAITERKLQTLKGQEARVLALLAAAYGRQIQPSVLSSIERAAIRWAAGQDCLAFIHLALAGLDPPEDHRDAARRLFMVDGLIKAGIPAEAILQALTPDAADDSIVRFDSSELRVPGGNGVESGRWAKTVSALPTLTNGAMRFLGRVALGALETAAENPVTLTLGLILIPKTTNLLVQGDVSEIPGLSYAWNRDETTLRLAYAGPNGPRDINATLGSDQLFRDGDKIVARLLPDETLVIDPAEVSSDLADKDGPNLCPKPELDKPGRGELLGAKDKDYEDQIKQLINPDNPTPRGYGYKFWDPQGENWVFIDDCQHRTGARVEIKSEYDGVLSFSQGADNIHDKWLDQSGRQLNVSEGYPLLWIFAEKDSKNYARSLFDDAGKGRERIITETIPRATAPQ